MAETGWIKLTDQLPPYGKPVYVRDDKGNIGVYTRYHNRHVGDVYSSRISTGNNAEIEWLDTKTDQSCPGARCDDTNRLEVLMQHPDKLFIDDSGDERLYSGADDGLSGKGIWRSDPRKAVDDIVKRMTR